MSKISISLPVCDLCEKEISPYYELTGGRRMIEYADSHQRLVIGGRELDICPSCCIILDRAMRNGIVDAMRKFLKERGVNA